MYYVIESILRECTFEECHSGKSQYVAVLSPEEWQKERDTFEMGIDLDFNIRQVYNTKAEVNYDSITGTFSVPDLSPLSWPPPRMNAGRCRPLRISSAPLPFGPWIL